jgi:hypothetical protein
MSEAVMRSTIYCGSQLHEVLRRKAAHSRRSVPEMVNEAARAPLAEQAI